MQVLVTGADGRIGRMLRAVWSARKGLPFQPVWSARNTGGTLDLAWDIETGPVPPLARGAVILHLAGVIRGSKDALFANSRMALRVCEAASAAGARHVFLASSAAVHGAGSGDLVEALAPAPQSDYGRAKLAMERAALCWAQDAGAAAAAPGVTCLRIGNVLGADALFGTLPVTAAVTLDPVPGHCGGPQRSYIGPRALADCIAALLARAASCARLPPILNVAAASPVFMADLLKAAKVPYQFGAPNAGVIARVCLSTARLASLVPPVHADPADLVQDWKSTMAMMS